MTGQKFRDDFQTISGHEFPQYMTSQKFRAVFRLSVVSVSLSTALLSSIPSVLVFSLICNSLFTGQEVGIPSVLTFPLTAGFRRRQYFSEH